MGEEIDFFALTERGKRQKAIEDSASAIGGENQVVPTLGREIDFFSLRKRPAGEEIDQDPSLLLAREVGQMELGKPGLGATQLGGIENLQARVAIAEGDTDEEKLAGFIRTFPEGELFFSKELAGEVLFRKKPGDKFARLKGGVINKTVDFFADDIGAIIGETMAVLGPGKFLKVATLAKMGVGAFFGEVAQETIQEARGVQRESVLDIGSRAEGKALLSSIGGFVIEKGLRAVVNLGRGSGIIGVRRGGARAQQSAQRLGIGTLPVNLVTDNPAVQKIGGQAGALVPTLSRYVDELEVANARAFTRRVRQSTSKVPGISVLETANKAEESRILNRLVREKRSLKEAGFDLQAGVAEADLKMRGRINGAYAHARTVETPTFTLTPLKSESQGVLELANQIGPPGSEVADLAKRIAALDDAIPDISIKRFNGDDMVLDATEQLRFLRSQAFDLKTPAPGQRFEQKHRLAGMLFSGLNKTLKNPVNKNTKFLKAYGRANRLASRRFAVRDKQIVIEAAKTETPTALAARLSDLSDPANADLVKLIRRAVPSQRFKNFQSAVINDLLSDPSNLSAKLASASPDTIRTTLGSRDIASLKQIGQEFGKLESVGIRKAIKNQVRLGALIGELADRGDTAAIRQLNKIIKRNGGADGPLGRTVRAGLMEHVLEASRIFEKGADRIDFGVLRNKLTSLNQSGATRLLGKSETQFLNDVRRVQDLLRLRTDAGTSIQAAEAAAGARRLEPAAIMTIIENVTVGRLFASRLGQKLLVGTKGKVALESFDELRLLGGVLSQAALDADKTADFVNDIISTTADIVVETPGQIKRGAQAVGKTIDRVLSEDSP